VASIGMNVARDGSSSPDLVRSLGATWIRIVAMPDVDLTGYFGHCRALGLQIMLVLARESGGDYAAYQRRYGSLIDCLQVGNEPDQDGESSWTMSPVELASLGRSARQVFGQDMPIVTAGMASGHPEWLAGMDLSWADAVAFHPYLKDGPNPNDVEDLPDVTELVTGYQALGKPLIISEWGWWSDDEARGAEEVRDMTRWAAKTADVEVYFHFCLDDGMVPPFGLYRADGSAKPAADYFMGAAAGAIHSLWPMPVVVPAPPEVPVPTTPDPWEHFTAEQIAEASGCPVDAITMYWPKIVEQLDHCGINSRATQIAAIGTIAIETASTFEPIHEYGTPADWAGYSGGSEYAGRGFIQLTHDYNYRAYGEKVRELWGAGADDTTFDLVAHPENALDPDIAAAVLATYFRDHTTAQGYSIPEAAAAGDWTWVRRLVQGGTAGLDRLVAVAGELQAAPDPVPAPEPSTLYAVTPGILQKMAELGDTPATNEYYPVADWSETFGASGRRYVYVASTNAIYVYAPAA
jgi:predicted chitinase